MSADLSQHQHPPHDDGRSPHGQGQSPHDHQHPPHDHPHSAGDPAEALVLGPGVVPHPLDPLGAEEIGTARAVLTAAGVLTESARIAYIGLAEPHKDTVLAFTPGTRPERRARVLLIDLAAEASEDVIVALHDERVESRTPIDPVSEGQLPLLGEEHALVREVLRADPDFTAALRSRGITDPEQVCLAALSAGRHGIPGEDGRRIARVLAHVQRHPGELPWAHPLDGLVAYVDLVKRAVVEVVDTGAQPIPAESGDYHDPGFTGPARTDLRPIEITQPQGPSFTVDGNVVTWQNWSLRLGYDMREGLVLHQLGFADGGRVRPIVHRASVAEMVVPYGDPSPVRFWQGYFDTGEYQLGSLANALELGCDCLGDITYLDATVANADGEPVVLRNAICMHEEDAGVLWKHTETFNGTAETRRQRRLVISFFVTVGNYDYGFYWYLYLDGTIAFEAKATGVVFTGVYDQRSSPYNSEVAPGLGAPFHQHLFSARLDMAVGGTENAVDEVEVASVAMGPENPHGNAFARSATRLRTEQGARRPAAPHLDRTWHVVNPSVHNRLGRPVAYALHPEGKPTLLADGRSSIARRAEFATHHLWVTRYDPAERYPAGDFVNQSPGGAGLPAYVRADRDIDGQDIVLWHTFGLTHFPRTEDWPVMPVDSCGFSLKPVGFFDRNPTLDVPSGATGHCAGPGDDACHC
ncbi:primary-amine oxidase [Murinocardiopsis flavida]|uniref:Amine oxidase n=1 Tax=Murinocardiopsis flavida TaxID=645275 RepID=A0A2P8DSX4_9ACTN|nr:primary-amine oxidase [Murinocardiopsis flavida]PSL00308.1 primary-amine oxidase [Murinocardiopsis flavida]